MFLSKELSARVLSVEKIWPNQLAVQTGIAEPRLIKILSGAEPITYKDGEVMMKVLGWWNFAQMFAEEEVQRYAELIRAELAS